MIEICEKPKCRERRQVFILVTDQVRRMEKWLCYKHFEEVSALLHKIFDISEGIPAPFILEKIH